MKKFKIDLSASIEIKLPKEYYDFYGNEDLDDLKQMILHDIFQAAFKYNSTRIRLAQKPKEFVRIATAETLSQLAWNNCEASIEELTPND